MKIGIIDHNFRKTFFSGKLIEPIEAQTPNQIVSLLRGAHASHNGKNEKISPNLTEKEPYSIKIDFFGAKTNGAGRVSMQKFGIFFSFFVIFLQTPYG